MGRYVCLLRGINVSGQRPIKMADLRDLCVSLGFGEVETYVQSGNVLFSTDRPPSKLAAMMTKAIGSKFGHDDVAVLALSATELDAIVAANPFIARGCDPSTLHVTFVHGSFAETALSKLGQDEYRPDELACGDGVIYLHCPSGYGRTKLNNAFFERKLKRAATTRNWNTTLKLRNLAGGTAGATRSVRVRVGP
ncbi:MAG: DUF1697 domain-containing protein [Polyangiaceae bacterium]|jgi:uncharacterized protein (DUF1697 family)